MSDKHALIVVTTTETAEQAQIIAEAIIKDRLAACAQVDGPITSFYWWEGKLERSTEWRCAFKTLAQNYMALEKQIKALHPYKCPQIIAVTIEAASTDYLKWIEYSC